MTTPDSVPSTAPAFTFADLLGEAMAHKADGERLKDGRKALKEKRPMASAEYEQMMADIKRIEIAREWLPQADVAMFQIQHCTACDNYAPLFTGLFQRQKNRHLRSSERWVAVSEYDNRGLPKEVKSYSLEIPFCAFCISDFGYPMDDLGLDFPVRAADDTEAEPEEADDNDEELIEDGEADDDDEETGPETEEMFPEELADAIEAAEALEAIDEEADADEDPEEATDSDSDSDFDEESADELATMLAESGAV